MTEEKIMQNIAKKARKGKTTEKTISDTTKASNNLNIYQKLLAVRKNVLFLKATKRALVYNYVSSSQTLNALRRFLDEQGLLLFPVISDVKITEFKTSKGAVEFFTEINIIYTWVNVDNPEERLTFKWYGQGIDTGEKGVGKALTYAEKYFLLKFFNIPTDSADPDVLANRNGIIPARPQKIDLPIELIGLFNEKGVMLGKREAIWQKALEINNYDIAKATQYVKNELNKEE